MKDTLTMKEMVRMIKLAEPKPIHFQALNEYLAQGHTIDNLMFITSDEHFEGIEEMNTTQGKLKVNFNRFVEKDMCYFFKMPEPLVKPMFPFNW